MTETGPSTAITAVRCPTCRHWMVSDNAEGWICDKRGGCGNEHSAEEVESDPTGFDVKRAKPRLGVPACRYCPTKEATCGDLCDGCQNEMDHTQGLQEDDHV